jgi:hypothetical protein
MQGSDLAAVYSAGAPANWRKEFFYEHGVIRSVDFIPSSEALVRRDWKYMFWPDHGREQLFHLAVDSGEENDVVAVPAHAAVLAEMRARFRELKAAAGAPL